MSVNDVLKELPEIEDDFFGNWPVDMRERDLDYAELAEAFSEEWE